MLVAQISDCHIVKQGELAYGRVDTPELLRRAVSVLRALPLAPDLLLVTGDLTEKGGEEEYATFLEITASLGVPILPVVGNHDVRSALTGAFRLEPRFVLQPGFIQYVVDDYAIRLIVLDTVTEGSAQPGFCAERLAWVEDRLAEDSRPTVIAMHHPPFPAGVSWMEPTNVDWAKPLARVVTEHRAVVRVVCGHVHRLMSLGWAGTCAMSAPSTAHQVFFDLAPASRRRFNFEAPGFLLHQWTDAHLVSYGVAIPGFADTFDL